VQGHIDGGTLRRIDTCELLLRRPASVRPELRFPANPIGTFSGDRSLRQPVLETDLELGPVEALFSWRRREL